MFGKQFVILEVKNLFIYNKVHCFIDQNIFIRNTLLILYACVTFIFYYIVYIYIKKFIFGDKIQHNFLKYKIYKYNNIIF